MGEHNTFVDDREGLQRLISRYFAEIFGSCYPSAEDVERGTEFVSAIVDEGMNRELLQLYTAEEVQKAIFQMAPLKSPGPDDQIISQNQSAFVPGRLMTDNVLIAFEINHFLRTKYGGKNSHAAIKLDISKAYDKVEWRFLERMLGRLGFDSRFVSLIMDCVRTVTYSFLLNGCEFGSLTPTRGLRQGDPLSPYLFLLCTKAFSSLLNHTEAERNIEGVRICRRAPSISHLLFADDTEIYCRANHHSISHIKRILETYAKASGQVINYDKSHMVLSKNTVQPLRDTLPHILGLQLEEHNEKYLGLPSMIGRSKRGVFSYIRDRV
ncbi:UNVERIFIED_CONTAM: putative mitochondrial protein [Sesamum radiatum]|uniref:Mitochondrial protein n=1 Tax=Sesamum radiatum TaxID=300843 RepID=A0AAW2RZE6_SESRA